MSCEVCDQDTGTLEVWLGDVLAHAECVPAYWRKDREKMRQFMSSVRALDEPEPDDH